MKLQLFRCPKCGNIVMKIIDSGVTPVCCGAPMMPIVANSTEASVEKHVPHVVELGSHTLKIDVGERLHPMETEHRIEFLCLETERGIQVVQLHPGSGPHACFCFRGIPRSVSAYCNLHGLWRKELQE